MKSKAVFWKEQTRKMEYTPILARGQGWVESWITKAQQEEIFWSDGVVLNSNYHGGSGYTNVNMH